MAAIARYFALLTVLALALCLSAQNQAPTTASRFRIRGFVSNALTGESVSGAEVAIAPAQNSAAARRLLTGKDGGFDFENLRAGKYSLQAEAHGFSLQAFNEHEQFSTAIVVGPGLDSENVQFRIWPDATISGTISDEQNEPVANADVILLRAGAENRATSIRESARAMSDDQGHYRFSHVTHQGRFYIAVSAQPWYADRQWFAVPEAAGGASPGVGSAAAELPAQPTSPPARAPLNVVYPLTYYPGSTDPAGAAPVVIKPGDRAIADVTLVAVPGLDLRVREPGVDSSRPLIVSLFQYLLGGTRQPLPAAVRFGRGVVELGGIPPGRFLLTAQVPGPSSTPREKVIEIFGDTDTDLSDASLGPAITGVVISHDGQPFARPLFVRLSDHASGNELGARSSSKGQFEIKGEHVDPGKYDVEIAGVRNRVVESLSAEGAKVQGSEVEISAGATVRLTIMVSDRAERIDGTALAGEKPYAGAMVVLVPQDLEHNLSRMRRDQSDSDGTFSFYNVVPGRYTVIALANGWDLDWQSPGILEPYLKHGVPLSVVSSPVAPIKVTVEQAGSGLP